MKEGMTRRQERASVAVCAKENLRVSLSQPFYRGAIDSWGCLVAPIMLSVSYTRVAAPPCGGSLCVLACARVCSNSNHSAPLFLSLLRLTSLSLSHTQTQFCFQFNREGTHKTWDKELVVLLLQLVLQKTKRVAADRVESFCAFLEASPDYQRITLDQWTSFWDFSQECDDLSSYDEATSAWPVLMDEYVEYMEDLQKGK